MLKKFPFGDSLLCDLLVLNPTKVSGCKIDILVSLAKHFPQLKLDATSDIDTLKEEFRDFCLSSSELPEITMYDCEGVQQPRCGPFWFSLSKMKTMLGEPRFPTLTKLTFGLLCIPTSNADAERGFSMLCKIHIDNQSSLAQSRIISLMAVKMNGEECCLDVELSSELLKCCKQTTKSSLQS